MRVFHARVKDADACVFDTQARFTRTFWAAYLRPVLYVKSKLHFFIVLFNSGELIFSITGQSF